MTSTYENFHNKLPSLSKENEQEINWYLNYKHGNKPNNFHKDHDTATSGPPKATMTCYNHPKKKSVRFPKSTEHLSEDYSTAHSEYNNEYDFNDDNYH